jgi:hypothetical protein
MIQHQNTVCVFDGAQTMSNDTARQVPKLSISQASRFTSTHMVVLPELAASNAACTTFSLAVSKAEVLSSKSSTRGSEINTLPSI